MSLPLERGLFFRNLPENKIGIDKDTHDYGLRNIIKSDFLTWHPDGIGNYVTVGNPPFGRNSSLAVKFFNHAANFSSIIAFIVPKTFQKQSIMRRLNSYFHLHHEIEIKPFSFIFMEKPYDVPCVFQIWEKKDSARNITNKKVTTNDFLFVQPDNAHFAFQRVGVRAGRVYSGKSVYMTRSTSSHYFIQDQTDKKNVAEILADINWNNIKHKTAGNPSISKSELIEQYELASS